MLHVLALLYHSQSDVETFRAFETKALSIVNTHGGKLVSAFVPQNAQNPDKPDEIHLIEFPDQAAFDAYRNDPKTMALSSERDAIVSNTIVYTSASFVKYDMLDG